MLIDNPSTFGFYGLILLTLILLPLGLFTVEQKTAAVIERFGRFVRVSTAGLCFKWPFIEGIAGRVSLRVMQLEVEVETKTLDNVFVKILTCVQFRILPEKVYEAFYTLDNAQAQIQAYVFDVVRARVPKINLDDVFSKKDEIADSVMEELQEVMNTFGYTIIKALVTDINPDARVKIAMNEINEAQRLRVAAMERGEAEKILKVKQAEAEAESKILQGKGIAGERHAIIEGFRDSLEDFQKTIPDSTTKDIMTLILMTQYFNTLKEMGVKGGSNTILLPHAPSSLTDVYQQIQSAMISAGQVPSPKAK